LSVYIKFAKFDNVGRVDRPIVDHLSVVAHLFISYHMCFILSDLKCYGRAGTQALEIIFEMQRKKIMKK
jgi:hypothetical protein